MKKARSGQATPMSKSDYETVYEYLPADVHKCFLAIAWYTGENPGNIIKSKVSKYYADPSSRAVRQKIMCKGEEIPCHSNLKEILENYKCPRDGYLFPSRVCHGHLSRQAFDRVFRRTLKKAKLEDRGYSLYSLRTGFMARLGILGCSPKLIQILSGLKSQIAPEIGVLEGVNNIIANF